MMYAYGFTLRERVVIVTIDRAANNLEHVHGHHWLSSADNAVVLYLTAPAYAASRASAGAAPPSRVT
eukprot:3862218-Lingulodinium_polyedra.AAC.1